MQTRDTIAAVRQIVAEHLMVDPSKVTDEARFIEDLGADSLDLVELAMAGEEEWDIEVSDDDIYPLLTVGDVIDYLVRVLATAVAA